MTNEEKHIANLRQAIADRDKIINQYEVTLAQMNEELRKILEQINKLTN